MIDIEAGIFTMNAEALEEEFEGILVSSEEIPMPTQFPSVSIIQLDTHTYTRSSDSESVENHVIVQFQFDIYSNLSTGRKAQCKKIAAVINAQMQKYRFARQYMGFIPVDDTNISRLALRYRGVVDKYNHIYRF